MLDTIMKECQRDEASRCRDLAYLLEDTEDERIDELMEMAEDIYVKEDPEFMESTSDLQEIIEQIDDIPDTTDEEISRIMESTGGITFDQMLGLDPIEESSDDDEWR